jgi:hypothetical protein
MDKYIGTVALLDKTEPFCLIEPLDRAFQHPFLPVALMIDARAVRSPENARQASEKPYF